MKTCIATVDVESTRQGIYGRITSTIVSALENGVRPWIRPWSADHAVGRITRPLRHNGQPYTGQPYTGHQRALALGLGDRARLRRADLDDLASGERAWRSCP